MFCIRHGFVFVYSMVLCLYTAWFCDLYTAWFCVCMLHGFVLVGYVFIYCMGFGFVYCMVSCLYTSVIPKQGGPDYQAKSTDVAKLAFRTVAPCSLTVCWRTHDDVFVTEVLDSVIFETLTFYLNLC